MAADVHALLILGSLTNQPVANLLHFRSSVTNAASPVTTSRHLINAWAASVEAAWLDCVPNNYSILGYKARRVNNTGGPNAMDAVAAAPGTRNAATDSALGPVIVMDYTDTVHWKTGRVFIPGIASDDVIANTIQPGLDANIATLNGLLISPITNTGDSFECGVWSPLHGLFYLPSDFKLSLKLGIQGRRLKPVL